MNVKLHHNLNHYVPKKSEASTAALPITWKHIFFRTTTRPVTSGTWTTLVVTLVNLEGREWEKGGEERGGGKGKGGEGERRTVDEPEASFGAS